MTSPKRRFVDIRIKNAASDDEPTLPNEGGPMHRLDWAFAGTSRTVLRPAPENTSATLSEDKPMIPHCTWKHWIDSHAAPFRDEEIVDEGDMYPCEDGERTLEKGNMVNPATGKKQDYVECWVDEDVHGAETGVLMLDEKDAAGKSVAKGMVVRIGGWCQGIVKVVEKREQDGKTMEEAEISLERWKQDEEGAWQRVVKLGRFWLPCAVTWEKPLKVGGEVNYRGFDWKVVEVGKAA